jgi:carbamoyl-phosphate synthase / aspartate carbamoyltransferase
MAAPMTLKLSGMALELEDGYACEGYSFGASKSVSGELVFQTGLLGYVEAITDPSYRGQILVLTYPLVGNYGVPSRDAKDELLKDIPAYFESSQIHIAGLVVASYSGENFSHYLATSSLGKWLQEQGVPAICGVDTRALTKRIREKGSMLGRLLLQSSTLSYLISNLANGDHQASASGTTTPIGNGETPNAQSWKSKYQDVPWMDPNELNLVKDGE